MSTPTPNDSPAIPLREWWQIEFQNEPEGDWLYYNCREFTSLQEAEDEIRESHADSGHWGYPFRFYPARIVKVTECEERIIPGIEDTEDDTEDNSEEGEACP